MAKLQNDINPHRSGVFKKLFEAKCTIHDQIHDLHRADILNISAIFRQIYINQRIYSPELEAAMVLIEIDNLKFNSRVIYALSEFTPGCSSGDK